jgi:hypothetical protein
MATTVSLRWCHVTGASASGDRPLQGLSGFPALRLAKVDVQIGRDGEPGVAPAEAANRQDSRPAPLS